MVDSFGKIMVEVRGNILLFILASIGAVVESSPSGDEVKIYATRIGQSSRFVVQRLIKILKSTYSS